MSNLLQNSFSRLVLTGGLIGTTVLAGCGGGGGATESTVAPLADSGSSSSAAAAPTLEVVAAAAPVELGQFSTNAASGDADSAIASAAASNAELVDALTMSTIAAAKVTPTKPSTTALSCAVKGWGTFDRPFAASSPWNSRPVAPVLGDETIPTSSYFPSIASGAYSSAAFKAVGTDKPMVVTGLYSSGVWDPDSEVNRPSITIPHWPEGVIPATGSDGHAEIVDTATGVVHSFWQLKQINGAWRAAQYAWTPLAGRGMGDPSHYFQGARAAGVSTLGGLIRISEVKNGDTQYRHALAMSLTFNGLSATPSYTFPATSADSNAATTNTGAIAMGSLMLLPANFDAQAISSPELRKVVETLKSYGAYVVDRNYGTPFGIYVENGADFNLHRGGWNNAVAADLQKIRAALRPVKSAAGWVDGNGAANAGFSKDLSLLSMRGYWWRSKGTQSGVFDTWKQALVFPATTTPIEQVNAGGRAYGGVAWANPAVGTSYRLSVEATGGARMRMTISDKTTNVVVYDSGDMSNAQTVDFRWPVASFKISTYAMSGVGGVESTVSAKLVKAVGIPGATPAPTCP